MTIADMTSALDEVQAKLAGAQLVAEFAHGMDGRDLDRALATWHPRGVFSIAPDTVLDGRSAIRAHLEKMWAVHPEVYHWFTNLSLTVRDDSTMHGECRVGALLSERSGTTIRGVGTVLLDYTKTGRTWLFSRQALTIHRWEPVSQTGGAVSSRG